MEPRPTTITPPPNAAGAPSGSAPQPTSGRENGGLMYFFIGAAVLALLLVIGFNMLGPEGASRTGIADGPAQSSAGPTTGGPSPAVGQDGAAQGSATGAAIGGQGDVGTTSTTATPQAADTPTPVGRESVGAPVGGALQSGQAQPEGISGAGTTAGDAPAVGARETASAIPAAPPASR